MHASSHYPANQIQNDFHQYSNHFFVSDATYENSIGKKIKLIYSGVSGELIIIDHDDYELIKTRKLPNQQSKLFSLLKNAHIIINSNETDLEMIIKRNKKAINDDSSLTYVILPSSFCNMGCTYCGQSHSKGGISDDLADAIINRISTAITVNKPTSLHIGWFGGEPMVGYTRLLHISDKLIAIADRANVQYDAKIVTNGSLLTLQKLIELHVRCKVTEVNITFDGPEEIHNARRFLKNGKDNFMHTIHLLQQAINEPALNNITFVLRTNIDKENEHSIDQYIEDMHHFGLAHENIQYEFKAVYPWSNDVSTVELAKQDFADRESQWMIKLFELGMNYSHLIDKNDVTCVALSPYAEVISSTGNIFSCTEHPLVPLHEAGDLIGNIHDTWQGRRATGQFDNFMDQIANNQVPCSSCHFLGVCGGACPKHWQENHIPCPSIKFNLQTRLDITAVKLGYNILINE